MEWTTSATQLAVLVPLTVMSMDTIRRFMRNRIERKGYPLPPGPTPLPFLGSALSVNIEEPFRTYTGWRAKYGDIMYIRLLDMDVVVLNSLSVATELLEKRSQLYSDRPFIATVDPYGHDSNFGFAQYGDHWRLCRRIFHQTFCADAVGSFHPMQLRKARQLILNVMDNPNDYTTHYSTFAAAVTMCSVYDYDPSPRNDQMVSITNNFIEASVQALLPEKAVLLKTFPFLLHIPEWLPGSWIKREARVAREWGVKMVEAPYQYVRKRMESREDIDPSMVSDHISRMEGFDDSYRLVYEKALKHASSTAFLGKFQPCEFSLMMTFTLAMVKNPCIWKRAQAEIDAAVGTDRLPEFDDRSSLPYVDAILRETLRWQPPVPLGVPHATTSSDIYNGFYIPKGISDVFTRRARNDNCSTGATVFGNIWAITRDETRYPNAEKFIPERFLDAQGMLTDDSADFVFGFGRRVCPGRHAANASVWSAMVTMLATVDFNLAKNVDDKEITFEAEYMNGLARWVAPMGPYCDSDPFLSHPLTFPCRITPRPHISKAFLERVLAK
ncbi:cytochrome P450 [Lanmaoa asiatica]|nr:cytochrome P450 [Lanmaoa asiatica]